MPTPRPKGKNKAITRTDVAEGLTKAWAKTKVANPLDLRRHVLVCREHGDEAAANAFLDAGGDDWWVALYRDPSQGAAILAEELRGHDLERLLDVARLNPELREQALDRFVALAEDELAGMAAENTEIPYGLLARVDLARARALVDAHPGLLEYDRGLHGHVRWGATSYFGALLDADYAAALALAPQISADVINAVGSDLYDVSLTPAQWVELTKAATTAQGSYGQDWLLKQVEYMIGTSSRANAKEIQLALLEACETTPVRRLDLLIELGHLEEARALAPKLVDPDSNPNADFLTEQRFILGLDDAEETIGRMQGKLQGKPANPAVKYSRGMQLRGMQRATKLFIEHNVDEATLRDLEAQRAALLSKGPESSSDQSRWADIVVTEHVLHLRTMAPGKPYDAEVKALVAAIKAAPSKQRWSVVSSAALECAKFDPVAAYLVGKQGPAASRHENARRVMGAFLPEDPGGALIALCDLCPKQSGRPYPLVEGSLEILQAFAPG